MGASSSKRTFFWQKKKSPIEKAWGQLKGALPSQKRKKKKSILPLDKLKLDKLRQEKHFKKRFSLSAKNEPIIPKRLSVGNLRKGSIKTAGKEKDGGGLEEVGAQIKRTFFQKTSQPEPSKLEKICLKKGDKEAQLEHEVTSSNIPQQGTKKTVKSGGKFLKLSIKQKKSSV